MEARSNSSFAPSSLPASWLFLVAWRTTYRLSWPPLRAGLKRRVSLGLLVLVLCALVHCSPSLAQPPGTLRPTPLAPPPVANGPMPRGTGANASPATAGAAAESPPTVARPPARDDRELTPKTFLVLDEAGNPVIVPGMTFEKLDQLLRLQEGRQQPSQLYTIESLEVRGRIADTSAELTVTARIDVEPTDGSWITVPLRMDNFHRTGPADVSGVERYRTDLAEDGSGYLLHLQSESRRRVVVVMRVVCRVAPPPGSTIEFRLPEAPSRVVLNVPGANVSASVVGRGDEVLRTDSEQNATEVTLDGGGGTFSMRFGTQLPVVDMRPILESESRIVIDWQQADNSPIASYDVAVRSQRGDLPTFTLTIPGPVPLLQQPAITGGAPFEIRDPVESELQTVSGSGDAVPAAASQQTIEVVPIGSRGDSRTEVSLVTQLRSEGGRPGGTVLVRGVSVSDAIEQTGEIEIRTPRDYRLRWTPQPWVSSLWDQSDADSLTTRTYRFRFDRVPFELPIWLSARAKQLRIEGDYRLTFYDSLASMRLVLRTSGGIPDSRILPLDVGDWTVQSLFVAGTTTPIEADQSGQLLEIDLASLPGGGESDRIEIVLIHPLEEDQDRVELPLPSIASNQETLGALTSLLSVSAQSDFRFIADLTSSSGIGEVLRTFGPAGTPDPTAAAPAVAISGLESPQESRYTLPDISSPGKLVGFLVPDRPQVSYQADAEISIAGNRVVEVLNWTVYPQGGLRGRLPISWGIADPASATEDASAAGTAAAVSPSNADAPPEYALPALPLWSVTVDDTPAILRADADGSYSIYSDRLAGGPHRLRLRRSRDLPPPLTAGQAEPGTYRISGMTLPRPGIADSTLRGPMVVMLRGDQGMELAAQDSLAAPDSQARWSDELTLTAAPVAELPLRLRHIDQRQDDVYVRRAVLRTALGRSTQHEHLIASVEGGGQFRLPLSGVPANALVRGSVDSVPTEVFRDSDDHCFVRLGEKGTHKVVIQIWVDRQAGMLADPVSPLLRMPRGTERFYWELITPLDHHLVWASPTIGRAMLWNFDHWRLHRQPMQSSAELANWVGATWETRIPLGNRYLLVGVDAAELSAVTMSRLAIWLIVGATVLLVSCLLTYYPAMRHPLLAITGAVLLGGMTLLLPDAAVLVGQVMLVAMLMVAVMAGVSHLLAPRRSPRVLGPATERVEPSSIRAANASRSSGSAAAAELSPSGSATEARA